MWHTLGMTSEDELRTLCLDVTEMEDALKRSRAARDKAIASAHSHGMRTTDLAEVTGLTREQVRRILRAAE